MSTTPKQKVILVTVFHSLVSKNILNTEALTILRDSGKYKIVLLVPDIKKAFFEQHYGHENIVVEGTDMFSFGGRTMEALMHNLSKLLIDTHYLHYKRRELLDADRSFFGWVRYFCREILVKLFSSITVFRSLFRFVDTLSSRADVFSDIFSTYNPDLVFSTDLFEQMGGQLLREARSRHIPTVGMVRSWDNCLSKGLLRVAPDTAIVNNEVIREELIHIHAVKPADIKIVGLPQFDSFISKPKVDRVTFFSQYGLDPEKKLVMFAPGGNVLSDTDGDICKILVDARDEGRLPKDIQFFVRNHPQHPADLSNFKDVRGMFIQSPGEVLDTRTHKETELTPDDQDFLRNILAHTDILIWVATSLCLDALVYDTPEVVVNFDGYKEKDYYHSVKRYHNEDHMKKMFALKPFRVASSPEELITYLNMYLGDSTVDAEGREAVRKQQLFTMDGKAGKRIAEILESRLV